MKKNDASPASNPLFSFDGHLTDTAFKLLMEEKLDPLQSLEVSEHLSFCDRCLERYTDILSGVPLLTEETDVPATVRLIEPPASLHTGIMPVSYTHLDVYKRQLRYGSNRSGR